MHCPQCHGNDYILGRPCPTCHFDHDIVTLEKLSNVTFLLGEIKQWSFIPARLTQLLQQRYAKQQEELEIAVGVRSASLTAEEAAVLHRELLHLNTLLDELDHWHGRGWLTAQFVEEQQAQLLTRQQELQQQLNNAPPPPLISPYLRQLGQLQHLLTHAQQFYTNGHFAENGYEELRSRLNGRITQLEIDLGLREPQPQATAESSIDINIFNDDSIRKSKAIPPPRPQRPPREPFSWDKLWDTLLSEKTLKAVLFLAVALLVGGAISIVVSEWENFSTLAQAAFLGGFTAVFYALGWYVRRKMQLEGSGLALTAVASLLVPLDFYTFYISGGFPNGSWPTVWLAASAVCLVVYTATLYLMHAEIFGYLVALAAGSVALAASNWVDLAPAWWVLPFTAVPLALALISSYIAAEPHKILTRPLRHMSLALSLPVLIISLGIYLFDGFADPQHALALGLSWWLATAILLLAIRPYPLQLTVLGALLAFPIGLILLQDWFIHRYEWPWAWHAAGLAMLLPLYIVLGWWTKQNEQTRWRIELKTWGFIKSRGGQIEQLSDIILAVAWLLAFTAGGLSLGRVAVMALVHTVLAVSFLLIAILWQWPRVLWAMSVLLITASGAWQGYRGVSPVELTLPWALLAILHVVAAVRLPDRHTAYRLVLTRAAVLLAAFALLPAIALFDPTMLSYALLNWLGVTLWLAYLYHSNRWVTRPNAQELGLHLRYEPLLLQWLAALALVPWLVLLGRDWSAGTNALFLSAILWLLLALTLRLRKALWVYRWPWQLAIHLTAAAALFVAHSEQLELPHISAIILVAVFYVPVAFVNQNRFWLPLSAFLLPYGLFMLYDHLSINTFYWLTSMGFLILLYMVFGYYAQKRYQVAAAFFNPLYRATHLMAGLLTLVCTTIGLFALNVAPEQAEMLKTTGAIFFVTAAYLLYAWLTNRQLWAHTAVWLSVLTGGLLVVTYSHGSGLSAFLVAVLALTYIYGERWLLWQGQHKITAEHPYGRFFRRAWRLFRRPLHVAGWILSAGAILAAIVRNLLILEAGTEQHLWSIATLLTLVLLYGLSARWFKGLHFVWLAAWVWLAMWTVTTNFIHINWVDVAPNFASESWFAVSWILCAFSLVAAGVAIAEQTPFFWQRLFSKGASPTLNGFSWAPQILAHLVVPWALLWAADSRYISIFTLSIGVLFYVVALLIDGRYRPVKDLWLGRFLYPAAALGVLSALTLTRQLYPAANHLTDTIVLIALAFPALWLGRRLSRIHQPYGLPLYTTAYVMTLLALTLTTAEQGYFTIYLFLAAALTLTSAVWFKQPLWLYAMSFFFLSGTGSGLDWLAVTTAHIGWGIILLGGGFFMAAAALRRFALHNYATPLLISGFGTILVGLIFASDTRTGALVGYTLASAIYAAVAIWLQQPPLLNLAVLIAIVPYFIAADTWGITAPNRGLAMWPGILAALFVGRWLDARWGWLNKERQSFPWSDLAQWPQAVIDRLRFWWALPLYYTALGGIVISAFLALFWAGPDRILLVLLLGAAAFVWAMYQFKLRPYLLTAAVWAQWAALELIIWLNFDQSAEQILRAFSPVILLTAALALLMEVVLNEGAPFQKEDGRWRFKTAGWSRMLYLLLGINFFITILIELLSDTSGLASATLTLIAAVLASWWLFPVVAYLALAGLTFAIIKLLGFVGAGTAAYPIVLASIALVYGAVGYGLMMLGRKIWHAPKRVTFWQRPLQRSSWVLSVIVLLLAFATATFPAVDGVRLFITVFAILGLLYLTIALAEQNPRIGYGALLLLLFSWGMWLLLIQQENEIQLYALPASTYLLGMGWMEWRLGNRRLAGWIDQAAFVLLVGSALWQSFGQLGALYALLLIAEGLVLVWIGSTRRIRRHLYVGVAAVLLAIVSQILEPLFNLNAFILLILGAALTLIGIGLEQRLEAVRIFSKEFRTRLEDWD